MPIPGCLCDACEAERRGGESAASRLRRQLEASKPSSLFSIGSVPVSFSISFDPAKETKSSMNPDHTPESLAVAVRDLANKDGKTDLSPIINAVESANRERKARIERSLRGMADLAVMAGAKGKRFVIVYWANNEARTAQGVEYPIEKRDSDGDLVGINVLINDEGHPFYSRYNSMERLRKSLDELKLTYHIAYYDK
jgi:hypothetical protein